ncbi:MAG: isopentenyl-diphosphate Delta-isomerase [Bacteroidia bacterium]|nr:isopentenyl-diphosphate Delta-isomerase [Bacteroidia bacterium]
MSTEYVILVNEKDEALGNMEKMEAHEKGLLHRALSVFIFNSKKQLLLQRRALHKYHSAGLWSNTCCSHPRPHEMTATAAKRRLAEEMGMAASLEHKDEFIYKVSLEKGLIEHEYDHVYIGFSETDPIINTEEVMDYKWISLEELNNDLAQHPEHYTFWFKLLIDKMPQWL